MKQAQRTSYWRLSTYFLQEIKKTKMLWKTSNDPCWHLVFRQKTWYEVKNLFIPVLPHMIEHWPGQTIESSAGMQQVVIISPQKLKKKNPSRTNPTLYRPQTDLYDNSAWQRRRESSWGGNEMLTKFCLRSSNLGWVGHLPSHRTYRSQTQPGGRFSTGQTQADDP